MAGSVDKKVNNVKFWLKGSISFMSQLSRNFDFPVAERPTKDIKTQFFVEINLFIVLVRVKIIPRHYTEFPSKQWIRHKFLKDEFSRRSQRYSTKSQKVGTIIQLKIGSRIVPNRPTYFYVDCCCQRQFHLEYYYLLDESSVLYAQCLNNDFRRKRLKDIERFKFVDTDKTLHNTNFTTLNGAISSYQTMLPCTLPNGFWSCVLTGTWSKATFHQDLELWDSNDLPNFPHPYPINCQESCIFLFFLQEIHPSTVLGRMFAREL